MNLDRELQYASLRVALDPIHRTASREQHKTLERTSATYPDMIQTEIAKHEAMLTLLRQYLPKVALAHETASAGDRRE